MELAHAYMQVTAAEKFCQDDIPEQLVCRVERHSKG